MVLIPAKDKNYTCHFKGGALNGAAFIPASYTSEMKEEQDAIEKSEFYKGGRIKLGKVYEEKVVKGAYTPVNDVANIQEARNYLLEKGAEMKDVASKKDILATAEKMGVEFPNMK